MSTWQRSEYVTDLDHFGLFQEFCCEMQSSASVFIGLVDLRSVLNEYLHRHLPKSPGAQQNSPVQFLRVHRTQPRVGLSPQSYQRRSLRHCGREESVNKVRNRCVRSHCKVTFTTFVCPCSAATCNGASPWASSLSVLAPYSRRTFKMQAQRFNKQNRSV